MKALVPKKRKKEIVSGKPGAGFKQKEDVQKVTVKPVLDDKTKHPNTSARLLQAVIDGNFDQVYECLELGAGIETRDKKSRTPLMLACLSESIEIAGLLIKRGADVNARAQTGLTVLMFACAHTNVGLVRLLLDNGSEINAKCDMHTTPLRYAMSAARDSGSDEVVNLLSRRGATL